MADFNVEIVVIGAGVIGLAIARALTKLGKEVLILEEEQKFGQITSSRNSGVKAYIIQKNSFKAKMCVEGNKLLYDYLNKYSIPHRNTKKILVATNEEQLKIIDKIKLQGENNGVENIQKISKTAVSTLEPLIKCKRF